MVDYELLVKQVHSLAEDVSWDITVMSNTAALLNGALEDINWVGFYLLREGELQLGPFQGKTACTRIPVGRGVCGTCIQEDRVIRVGNVHDFPGHIACDSASMSEIVLPLHRGEEVVGVLDIDSPVTGRFSKEDEAGLLRIAEATEEILYPAGGGGFA